MMTSPNNDDTGYGMTECGLVIFPHEVVNTDKPVWDCNGCTPDKAQEESSGGKYAEEKT